MFTSIWNKIMFSESSTLKFNSIIQFKQNFIAVLVINFGIQGRFCENKCPKGTYGIDCASNCFCYNENECDPITGDCNCIGFIGNQCEEPCPEGTYGKKVSIIQENNWRFCCFHSLNITSVHLTEIRKLSILPSLLCSSFLKRN